MILENKKNLKQFPDCGWIDWINSHAFGLQAVSHSFCKMVKRSFTHIIG